LRLPGDTPTDGAYAARSESLRGPTSASPESALSTQPPEHSIDELTPHQDELILAMKARERFLDGILGSLEAFLAVEKDWRVTFANKAAEEMAGRPAHELMGREVWEALPPGLIEQSEAPMRRAMAERVTVEYEVSDREGVVRHGKAYPLADGGLAVYVRDISELRDQEREAEQALAVSERRFRGIVETTADGILIGEPDGTVAFVNQRMADMLGYTADELVGRPGPDLVYPEWLPAVRGNREALSQGEVLRGEFKLRRKDGSPLWTMFSSSPMRDENGAHIGNLTLHTDISDRKGTEEALRRSEERFRGIFESRAAAIALSDRADRLVLVNQAFADLLGYRREELVGLDLGMITFADDLEMERPLIEAMLAGASTAYHIEKRYVRKDGSPVWVELEAGVLRDAEGRPEYSIAFARDITRRRANQVRLRESEERFRMVLGAAPVSVAAQDADLRYVWSFNQRAAPAGGVVGKTDDELFTPEEAAKLTAIKRRVLDEAVELRESFWLGGAGGGTFVDCTFSPLRDAAGDVAGVGVTMVDLTPKRIAEDARLETEETLRSFYDSVSLLMGVAELEGERLVPVSGNRAAEELFGGRLAPAPRRGTAVGEDGGLHAGRLESELAAHYRESERLGGPVRFEYELEREGDQRLLAFTVAHIGSGTSERPRFSFVGEDITERRRTEVKLRDREVEQAARDEKSRLARDLHDSVTQALFAASLKAEALTVLEGVPVAVEGVVEEVRRLNRGALAQMRTMLLELRGDPLEQIPLRQLLRNVVEATESRTHTDVDLRMEDDVPVPAEVHVMLYRVAQEALNNVARHAQAQSAWVELLLQKEHARLSIRDDGCGFDPGPVGPEHLGLRSMRERAREAGAEFRLVGRPGIGTEIVVEWDARPREVDTSRP
jgi:PAS domain S-box-containing protein